MAQIAVRQIPGEVHRALWQDNAITAMGHARGQDEAVIRDIYVRGMSMKSWVTAPDIANTVSFLASPAAAKISGQILAIDGHTETQLAP